MLGIKPDITLCHTGYRGGIHLAVFGAKTTAKAVIATHLLTNLDLIESATATRLLALHGRQ
ncbi:MAG: hypothetical protein VW870_15050, partial [Rhodobiaceae bacterium]